jgi:hypothetical protein
MEISREVTEFYKIWIAGGGMILALIWSFIPRRVAMNALVLLTLISAANYSRLGPTVPFVRVDTYDVVHYYINAKYFDELGYYDLYPTILLVDAENEGPFFDNGPQYLAQDENGHAMQSIRHGIDRGKVVKAERFTDESWKSFTHDVLYLLRTRGCMEKRNGECQAELNDGLWRQLIQDHGFNGTTAWTVVAEPVAKAVPVEWIKVLGYIDIVLLSVAVGFVVWAYGGTAAWFTVLWLLVGYSTRWPYLSWVFLRYDWLAFMLIGMSLAKKGKPLAAGFFAGWASTLRMFPALWMWGPLGKGVAGLFRRHVSKPLLTMAAGFILAVALLQGAAIARYGTEPVKVHFENMLDHNDPMQLSSRRIGLALAISQQEGGRLHKYITTRQKKVVEQQKPLRYGLAILVMLALAAGVRRARDDEAYAFGFLPFFLLTTASYYYYVARITMATVHAADLSLWRNRVGLAMLFGLEAYSNYIQVYDSKFRMVLIGNLAIGIAVYSVVMVIWLNWEALRAPTETTD